MPGEKICMFCQKDCSALPRVKDPAGRYACRACAEQAQERAQPAEPQADDGFDVFAGLNAQEIGIEEAAPAGQNCPNCGVVRTPGAVVCMRCGYNQQTGRVISTKAAQPSAASGAAVAAASAASSFIAAPILWLIGGMIGGLIGAGVWGGITFLTNTEFGLIAWGIGVLVGVGVAIGAKGNGNALSGCLAVIIAFLAVGAGKYFAMSLLVDKVLGDGSLAAEWTDEDLTEFIADDMIFTLEDDGRAIEWRRPGIAWEDADWPDDYPTKVVNDAEAQFAAMSPQDKQAMRDERNAYLSQFSDELRTYGFWASWGLFDFLWVFLAIASAYKIGSTEGAG